MKTAMNNPTLYNASNQIQRKAINELLKEYTHKIKWDKSGDTAIDIGSGDGSVTLIVKNFAPYGYKKFVGSDVSEEMVNYASKHYGHEDITFRVLDIGGDLPKDLIGSFNHVFSSFALQWVKDQERAFRNIYNLLTDDGDCLLSFIASTAIYSVYNVLGEHPKWKSWLKELDVFVSPYHDKPNPETTVAAIAEKIGFKNVDVKLKHMKYVLDDADALQRMVQSVEPFNMPQDVFDEFMIDYLKTGQELGFLHFNTNGEGQTTSVTYDYTLVVVHATK